MPDLTGQFAPPRTRELLLGAGDPGAFLSLSRQLSGDVSSNVPTGSNLGFAVMELLKAVQQGHIQPQAEASLVGAEQERIRRLAQTPSELIGAPPSLQESVRQASAGAVEPTIKGFTDILRMSKKLVEDLETQQNKSRDDMRALFQMALTTGSEAIEGLLKNQPNALKIAGLDPETVQTFITAKRREEQQKPEKRSTQIIDTPSGKALIDTQTGDIIKTFGPEPGAVTQTQVSTLSLLNSVLGNEQLSRISGGRLGRFLSGARFTGTAGIRSQLIQLKALTSLEGRERLKGTGTISDFEARMLSESANALNFSIQDDGQIAMSDKEAKQHISNIRGVVLSQTGRPVTVVVTDPNSRESRVFENMPREDINDAVLQGFIVNYR